MSEKHAIVWSTEGAHAANHDRYLVDAGLPFYAVLDADVQYGHGADVVLGVLQERISEISAAIDAGSEQVKSVLEDAVRVANAAVYTDALTPRWRGSGSTITCCTLTDTDVVGAHVGDSRLYIRRGGNWRRVTTDHALVEELGATGASVTLAEAKKFHSNVITRALGFGPDVEVDTFATPWAPGDCLLLCTDGAWGVFDPQLEGAGPAGPREVDALLAWIVEQHAANGGRSNATALLVQL